MALAIVAMIGIIQGCFAEGETHGIPHAHLFVLSPLESLLITSLTGLICALITKFFCGRSYVTKEFCQMKREGCLLKDIKAELAEICEAQKENSRSLLEYQKRQAEVFRIVLTRLDVPVEEQNRLLDIDI